MAARLTEQERAFRAVKEYDLMKQAIDLAKFTGWLCHHQRPGMTKDGRYRSQIMGHKGFPDVVFTSETHQRIIFAEFKRETEKLRPEQEDWAKALKQCAGRLDGDVVHYRVWRPSDWPEIQHVLTTGVMRYEAV